jgi:hypothetical protein
MYSILSCYRRSQIFELCQIVNEFIIATLIIMTLSCSLVVTMNTYLSFLL